MDLTHAIALAEQAHQGQVDKAGKPYIEHPLRVMGSMHSEMERIVGVLHDAIEDSDLTLAQLVDAGFGAQIVAAIDAITKREGEAYETYLERVIANPIALRVKIADMSDNMNMARIIEPTQKDWQRLEKYREILPKLQAALQKC
ncbi:MAG: HD domain-containing protein [Anaerolineae bacterium]|nr:HD domain-containing protein [Gloeobacterales cyanobacterium ES-bin-313]